MHLNVVIPAFRRPRSLKRLLESLLIANSHASNFSVTVSLDGGYATETLEIARYYKTKFPNGSLEYFIHQKNIGLRNHILWCGNLSKEFGSITVLEDDLLVDKHFSEYAASAIRFYSNELDVAGISLYSQQFNEFENLPFYPAAVDGYANFFMQVPCSWGQIWTQSQWTQFYEWYSENQALDLYSITQMPLSARCWPSSSWKKYFYAYLVQKNKYIVYPFRSYSTNCSDPGGFHNKSGINFLQVPLLNRELNESETKFSSICESKAKYDSFLEQQYVQLDEFPMIYPSNLALDIYASKPLDYLRKFEFVLTTRDVRKTICKYPLAFKPIDLNFKYPEENLESGISLARSEDVLDKNMLKDIKIKYMLAQYFSPFDLSQSSIVLAQFRVKIDRLMRRLFGS